MLKRFENKKIILGVCAGIAAYKSVELARQLQQEGALVQVVMTDSAQDFIGKQTFQAITGFPVWTDTNDASFERCMAHIDLSRWADMLIIAPATANFMAKIAHGMADDLLSLLYLMLNVPIMICPAMNMHMWSHPATIANTKILQERQVVIVGPDSGSQACGDTGLGRMREPEWIMDALELIPIYQTLKGQRFVVTAGPTQEAIDPVRFISNHSSGRMGYALGAALSFAGAEVVLISGPCQIPVPPALERVQVNTAQEMYEAVLSYLKPSDNFLSVAAVCDFKVNQAAPQKIKKNSQDLHLSLQPCLDILHTVKQKKLAKLVIGFAAETERTLENAREKLYKKADIIIANTVGQDRVFGQDNNQVYIITKEQEIHLAEASKLVIARQLVEFFKTYLNS
jgi:phosphopantothenoylcysteine decarboxylase / phosphopantothenate---cysteine ligase